MAVGVGMYLATVVAVVITLFGLWALRPFRRWLRGRAARTPPDDQID
jgi:uncharacterized membrane protein YhiD involved in acid resistance